MGEATEQRPPQTWLEAMIARLLVAREPLTRHQVAALVAETQPTTGNAVAVALGVIVATEGSAPIATCRRSPVLQQPQGRSIAIPLVGTSARLACECR